MAAWLMRYFWAFPESTRETVVTEYPVFSEMVNMLFFSIKTRHKYRELFNLFQIKREYSKNFS